MKRKGQPEVEAKIERFIRRELADGRRVLSQDIFARAEQLGINRATLIKYAPRWRGTEQVAGRHVWFLLPETPPERPTTERRLSAWPYPNINLGSLTEHELLRLLDDVDDPLVRRLVGLLQEKKDNSSDDSVSSSHADGYSDALREVENELHEIEGATSHCEACRGIFDRMNGWVEGRRRSLGTK